MGEAFIFYANGTYKRLSGSSEEPAEGFWLVCDTCIKPQPKDGGIMDESMFVCKVCLA